jgi:hypothetical protein
VGPTVEFFGPYTLEIGCTQGALANSTDNMSTSVTINVGDDPDDFYTFVSPTPYVPYCPVISNMAVEADGTTDSSKVTESGAQPVTKFNLVNSNQWTAQTFTFKVSTTF